MVEGTKDRSASAIWTALVREVGEGFNQTRSPVHEAMLLLREAVIDYEQNAPLAAILMCRAAVESAGRSFLSTIDRSGGRMSPVPDPSEPEIGRQGPVAFEEVRNRLVNWRVVNPSLASAMVRIQNDGRLAAMVAGEERTVGRLTAPELLAKSAGFRSKDFIAIPPSASRAMALTNIRDTAAVLGRLARAANPPPRYAAAAAPVESPGPAARRASGPSSVPSRS
ncbi:MAG: hypothetical protein WA761_08535 [Thermoplasmata archaeon]